MFNYKTHKLMKSISVPDAWRTLNDDELKILQKQIEVIAKDLFDISKERSLNLTLAYGSVLGAVRHNGFIPWDDDIDVCILRKDLNELLRGIQEKYPDKYWIHTMKNTHNYGLPMVKVRMKGTIARGLEDFENDECGIFVDVFIVENTFDNVFLRKIHIMGSYLLKGLLSCRRMRRDAKYIVPQLMPQDELYAVVKRKARLGLFLSFFSLDTWSRLADWWFGLCKNDTSKQVFIPGALGATGSIDKRETFLAVKTHDFDGNKWYIPQNEIEYLQKIYGDFMTVPPPEKREQHTFVELKLSALYD